MFIPEEGDFPPGRRWRYLPPEWMQFTAEVEFVREPAATLDLQNELFPFDDGDGFENMMSSHGASAQTLGYFRISMGTEYDLAGVGIVFSIPLENRSTRHFES